MGEDKRGEDYGEKRRITDWTLFSDRRQEEQHPSLALFDAHCVVGRCKVDKV